MLVVQGDDDLQQSVMNAARMVDGHDVETYSEGLDIMWTIREGRPGRRQIGTGQHTERDGHRSGARLLDVPVSAETSDMLTGRPSSSEPGHGEMR
jgi:hypothetical protein